MKKICSLIAFVGFLTFHVFAQSKYLVGVYFSPGYNTYLAKTSSDLSWLDTDVKRIEKAVVGYQVGAFVDRKVSEKIQISAGLGYSTYNTKIDSLEYLGIDKYTVNQRFLEVPIVARYAIGLKNYMVPYVSFAYTLNVYLNTQSTYSLAGSNRNETNVLKNDFNSLNHSLRLALGYNYSLDKKWNLRTECYVSSFVSSLTNQGIDRRPVAIGVTISLGKNN